MRTELRAINGEYFAVLTFDAGELRGIAAALGPNDMGGLEMLRAAEDVDTANAGDN